MKDALHPHPRDRRLRYALRATGFAVVLASMFFLMKSITLDPVVNGFFAVSAGIGFLILIAGWIPGRPEVVRYTTTYRPRYPRPAAAPKGAPAFEPVVERHR
jgi:hypothetical protein